MGTTNLHIEEEYPELINSIKENEGFAGSPYNDSLGIPTIGYGTKLPISTKEGELLLNNRLARKIAKLHYSEPVVDKLPEPIRVVLYEMAYQLGVSGVLKFKNMFEALKDRDYIRMIAEMKNSKWYHQTPNRVNKLIDKIESFMNDN